MAIRRPHRGRLLTAVSKSDKGHRRSSELLPALPPLGPRPDTVTPPDGDRLSSIQKENQKLRDRLKEAERSISNYRSLLTPNRDGKALCTVSTQTSSTSRPPTAAQDVSSGDPEKSIEKLTKTNASLMKKIEDLNSILTDTYAKNKRLSEDNVALVEQLERKIEDSNQRNEEAAAIDSKREILLRIGKPAIAMQGNIDRLKTDIMDLRAMSEDCLGEFSVYFEDLRNRINVALTNMTPNPPAILLSCATSPIHGERNTASVATSPVSWQEERNEVENEAASALLETNAVYNTDLIEKNEYVNKILVAEGDEKLSPTNRIPNVVCNTVLIEKVRTHVEALAKAHRLEINAVKHTAHCKDLSRLASQREISLERDRAMIELKGAR